MKPPDCTRQTEMRAVCEKQMWDSPCSAFLTRPWYSAGKEAFAGTGSSCEKLLERRSELLPTTGGSFVDDGSEESTTGGTCVRHSKTD